MPVAPRQGRKGGKISASPVLGVEHASVAVSPGSLLTDGSNDPSNDLEFRIEALMDSRRERSKAHRESGAGAKNDTAAADAEGAAAADSAAKEAMVADTAATAAASATDTNVFKFDMDAIDQIGQGVVIGGSRNVRTDSRKPDASLADVQEKLAGLLVSQKALPARIAQATSAAGVREAMSTRVVILRRPHDALGIAVGLSRAEPRGVAATKPRVLVVLPRYYEVASVADALRARAGAESAVGELCGQSFTGAQTCRLWVTSAETAFTYLRSQKSLSPFTHMVVPGLSRMTPLVAYFLWGLRERVFRQSANLDPSAPPLHLVMCANEGNVEKVKSFFLEQEPVVFEPPHHGAVVEFSYDEVNALAEMNVLEVDVDSTGKFPGPHRKLVDHAVKLAAKVVASIIAAAETRQCIYVTTADVHETREALQSAALPNTTVYAGRNTEDEASDDKHRVFVMPTVLHSPVQGDEVVHFVLDMGTVRRLSQQSKSESFMTVSSSEWATAREVRGHRGLLTPLCSTGYFALYPPAAVEVFLANERSAAALQAPIFETEDALLHSCRAQVPVGLCHDVLVPTDADTMEQVVFNLAEKCLLASPEDLSITFLGEVAARLPLEMDLAHFVINGGAMGLGEAAILIAGTCALPFRSPSGKSGEELAAWKEAVLQSRQRFAGRIAQQSDVLADALVYLEWWILRAEGQPTGSLVEELQVHEKRFEQIRVLVNHLRVELSDYVFIDDLDEPRVLREVQQSIRSNAAVFTFLESVSLARRATFVRDAGTLNPRDRAASLAFVRTAKKVTPVSMFPSSVPWEVGAAMVCVDLRNYPSYIGCSRVSAVSTGYLLASLLLLYPQVEYSEPTEMAGRGRVVCMSVTCNRQMKRFRVSIDEAAAILDFRQRWNTALGYLQALRTRRRPISRRRFEIELKEKDRSFDLSLFHVHLRREFVSLVTELDVTEHQGSFTTFAVHCLSPMTTLAPTEGCEASDVVLAKRFHDGELAQAPSPGGARTPATLDAGSAVSAMVFPTQQALFEDDEDEIEFIAESYFLKHGPIVDDDDD